jgi:hypothetical protein
VSFALFVSARRVVTLVFVELVTTLAIALLRARADRDRHRMERWTCN